ncbi:unnamed protein product, partial [Didymodactylos carnosus]
KCHICIVCQKSSSSGKVVGRHRKNVSFFNIPTDPTTRQEWFQLLNLSQENINSNTLRVCSERFDDADIDGGRRRTLKSGAFQNNKVLDIDFDLVVDVVERRSTTLLRDTLNISTTAKMSIDNNTIGTDIFNLTLSS